MSKLVEGGPSPNGSSTWGPFMACPFLWWASKLYKGGGAGTARADALGYGSAAHLMEAQFYRRAQAHQDGGDREEWTPPIPALAQGVQEGVIDALPGEWALALSQQFQRMHPRDMEGSSMRILAVEQVFEIDFGANLDVPGHPKHGQPIRYAPRCDLAWGCKGRRGAEVWFTDHKTTSDFGRHVYSGYAGDFQFLMLCLIGRAHFGKEFAGVKLHLIPKHQDTHEHVHETLDVPGFLVDRMPELFVEAAHRKARYELELAEGRDPWTLPRAVSKEVCDSRYGLCRARTLCHQGPPR